ncbi:MAG TPA: hypothetical protein VHZ51_09780 [Ktedonobacteraceae bacterium]|jgi:uncharacterized membrane protein|nr:hypothetical protein [Ktedonobacteraceae bacterium]
MSYHDPNQQEQYSGSSEYGQGYNPSQPQPQPADPYNNTPRPEPQGGYYQPSGGAQQPNPQGGYYQPGASAQQPNPQDGGYQQGGYQQPPNNYSQSPYNQKQWFGQPSSTLTTWGIAPNIESALCYVLGWITGLIILFTEKQNRQVRYHAIQSIIVFGGLNILVILLGVIPFLGPLLIPFVSFVTFVAWVGLIIIGFTGYPLKIPVVSDYATRYVDQLKF